METSKFIELIKSKIAEYVNKSKFGDERITEDDIYIVWLCKTLKNSKALASTTVPDGMYYEITYNGDKNECYIDAYKKLENICVSL